MNISERVRSAIERRLNALEATLKGIEGIAVERRGDTIRLRGRRLVARSIADARLRFAGLFR